MVYANKRFLSYALSTDLKKIEQVEKMAEITFTCTSDSGMRVEVETMENHIIRFTVEGTRCKIRFCWSVDEQRIIRQPRGLKRDPIFGGEWMFFGWLDEVAEDARKIRTLRENEEEKQ